MLLLTRNPSHITLLLALLLLPLTRAAFGQVSANTTEAKRALSDGRYTDAEDIYRRMLRTNPTSSELLTDLGIALGLQGKSAEAIAEYTQALRQDFLPKTYVLLAAEHCHQANYVTVRPMLERIAVEDANRPDLLHLIAPCALDANDPVDAVRMFQKLTEAPALPQDQISIQLAQAYLLSAQFFYTRLDAASNKEVYVHALQTAREGKAANARGAYADAVAHSSFFKPDATYSQAIEAWRTHQHDTALLYQLTVLSGEESIAAVDRARLAYPDSPYVAQLMARVTAQQGKRIEAITQYQALLKTNPDLPHLRLELGTLYIQEQDWESALSIFQQQLLAHPDDAQSTARVSQSLLELERYDELKTFLEPRAKMQHASLWLRLDLATALLKLSDTPGATSQLILAERDYPADKSVHYRLMRLYTAAGDTEAAARENILFHNSK